MSAAESGTTSSTEAPALALEFARKLHLGQHRKQTHEQFIQHPIRVAGLIEGAGLGSTAVTAAYLHDVVEKTPVELEEIEERFGPEVAHLVGALSEDPEIEDYRPRKRGLRRQVLAAGHTAAAIYAADRVANIRDWLSVPADKRTDCATRLGTDLEERMELWGEDLDELTRYDGKLPFLPEIQAGLEELRAQLDKS